MFNFDYRDNVDETDYVLPRGGFSLRKLVTEVYFILVAWGAECLFCNKSSRWSVMTTWKHVALRVAHRTAPRSGFFRTRCGKGGILPKPPSLIHGILTKPFRIKRDSNETAETIVHGIPTKPWHLTRDPRLIRLQVLHVANHDVFMGANIPRFSSICLQYFFTHSLFSRRNLQNPIVYVHARLRVFGSRIPRTPSQRGKEEHRWKRKKRIFKIDKKWSFADQLLSNFVRGCGSPADPLTGKGLAKLPFRITILIKIWLSQAASRIGLSAYSAGHEFRDELRASDPAWGGGVSRKWTLNV